MTRKEDNLSHGGSERKTRPTELEEGEEMHPLVFRLLKKRVDPAVVPVHLASAQGAEVADHTSTLVCKGGISASSQVSQILRTRDRDHDFSSPFLEQRQQSPERWLD